MAFILIVDDDNLLRWALRRRLEQRNHIVHEAVTLAEAEAHLRDHRPELVLLDVNLPDGNGIDFLQAQRETLGESLVLVMTASGEVDQAVRAMKLGAWDFLSKPLDHDEMISIVDQALERQRDRNDAERSRRERESSGRVQIVGESEGMRRVLDVAATVATSAATTILIGGETGTGKELLARYIHALSARAGFPVVPVDAASLPETLVESELFGHEKGAFTDARAVRRGVFELAHGGSVLLDEIGELPFGMQTKLLRFLEERSFRRVGGARTLYVDVRVIAMTNRNLREEVEKGTFRRDLFYRLEVFPITIPPLRERRDDIVPLAQHFLTLYASRAGKSFRELSPEVRRALTGYDWPGNVRELRNLMERIAILEKGDSVREEILGLGGGAASRVDRPVPESLLDESVVVPLDTIEYDMVSRAMRLAKGNQSLAGRMLGISRDQLRYRLNRYRAEGRWSDAPDSAGEAEE
jgi:DNA-binding NtrC family response regulator